MKRPAARRPRWSSTDELLVAHAAPSPCSSPYLREGKYKTKVGKVWFPVLIRVEFSKDDDGRTADRPRLVLYLGSERHERPDPDKWLHRIWPVESEEEWLRLSKVHTAETASPDFNLSTAPSLF